MPDDITYTATSPAGPPNATKQVTDEHVTRGHMPVVKLAYSADGDATPVTADANGLRVSGTVTANAGTGTLAVSNTVLSVVGTGTEAAAQRVTIATDSTGVLSIDDNGGSLTVDGTVTANAGTGTMAVSNAGTFAVQDSQKVVDNAAFTDGTTPVLPAGFIYDEVAGTVLTENDAAAARINLNRAQIGVIEDGATRGRWATVSAANALKVDGSAVTQPVSGTITAVTAITNALPAGNNNIGDVDIVSGTITTVSTVTALTTLTGGGVAHDGADAGNPIKTGARATTADITAVAAADRTDTLSDTIGYGLVRPYALHENLTQGATAAITGTASTEVIAAGAAGVRNYITSLTVINSHATVSTVVEIRDGAATVIHRGYALAAGGGYVVTFPTPLRGTAATAINAFAITTGSNVYVSGSGYRAAV